MSWSMLAVPLHTLGVDGMAEWIAQTGRSRGLPDGVPEALPLPSAAVVLGAFRSAGCHGTNWFEILGEAVGSRLPVCQDPGGCGGAGGLDLGEVSLQSPGRASSLEPMSMDAAVEAVSFRKPNGAAVLQAVCALALIAGPQLVFDDQLDAAFVIWPGDRPEVLQVEWFW